MMMFGNVGFMGFPLTEALLGEEALIYAVIFNVIFNLLVYSLGIFMISKTEEEFKFPIKKLLNVPLISACLSIVLYFCKIQLPNVVVFAKTVNRGTSIHKMCGIDAWKNSLL